MITNAIQKDLVLLTRSEPSDEDGGGMTPHRFKPRDRLCALCGRPHPERTGAMHDMTRLEALRGAGRLALGKEYRG